MKNKKATIVRPDKYCRICGAKMTGTPAYSDKHEFDMVTGKPVVIVSEFTKWTCPNKKFFLGLISFDLHDNYTNEPIWD